MKALIIVDLQKDFVQGGSLAVPDGVSIIRVINQLQTCFDIVVATKDWHPKNHISFASTHGKKTGEVIETDGIKHILWPDHCVQNTKGAEFVDHLNPERIERVFYKGADPKIDSYSGFFDDGRKSATGLDDYLKNQNVREVYIVGLATDYCVKYTAIDAAGLGYQTCVIQDAVKGVKLRPDDVENAFESMKKSGVVVMHRSDLKTLGKC
ncbi:MAG: nicotinamidase [Omnitrophica bacterium RIFCSPLOWO2_12_FULL_44_17]|uniref:Nicotinamidase n=1 Tax=Candidatus Danuiimicrobium aquiferis TaxID=1801832 RepID=A0A1G1KTT0_9BACT|nr:MAG: nicotinamidase [Omnitrophica bacterium RIFCSPHIGHO2_02_FULL_45_28]OGW88739.1 MAG: nicotinamidase [Omnitrophica bacterium RIFCSPHIGHO2_12_FULL_44_12]OGW96374.1 MAG: nicotinamidase [Omnitrophica bacterium RIFCSPLOWO2_12_FULL_44_17]OGX04817.1 MAG: nicotinamidase [Omnitrophica bacterium RIFCSPLOWO2_02_FULL_44_11]